MLWEHLPSMNMPRSTSIRGEHSPLVSLLALHIIRCILPCWEEGYGSHHAARKCGQLPKRYKQRGGFSTKNARDREERGVFDRGGGPFVAGPRKAPQLLRSRLRGGIHAALRGAHVAPRLFIASAFPELQ